MGLTCGKQSITSAAVILHTASTRKRSSSDGPRDLLSDRIDISSSSETDEANAAAALDQLASVRDQGIVVLVRIRPTSKMEEGQRSFLRVQGPTQLHVPASKNTPTEKTCSFDAVLSETTSQEEVYRVAGPKLIHNVLRGFNATMIAYGQTGSGKTFTMEGTAQDPGVTPRLCRGLFKEIAMMGAGMEVTVVASYVEVYQENIRDLLDIDSSAAKSTKGSPKSRKGSNTVSPVGTDSEGKFSNGGGSGKGKPTIRESKEGVYVENVTAHRVDSEDAVLELLAQGSSARTKGETQMNAVSSRSHAVLTLSITQSPVGGEAGGATGLGLVVSKIGLVDLAGSERAKSTGAAGQRLKEGAQINKSLSALGNVIKALTSGGGAHVPYRDSKLTRLLQDSLGGTAYTVVCCNVSPIEASEPETLSTLRFAERLKKVKNKMVVHMDARSRELIALKRENMDLRAKVKRLEGVIRGEAGVGDGAGANRGIPCSAPAMLGGKQLSGVDGVGTRSSSSSSESRTSTRSAKSCTRRAV
eukprot:jgi/Undpi1/1009/HiC_scaffold_10.g04473.m1